MNFELGFLASIVVVLLAARLLGEAAQRLGQPAVIGQLVAGIMLGPSFLGLLWPDAEHALFSADPVQKAMLQGFGEFGILLLLVLTGMEVDLRLLRKIGWPSLSVSLAGLAVPFAFGAALGFAAPSSLIANAGRRLPKALFLGVALSVSSIKVVASVVREMNFARRDLGQIIVASSIIEDLLGWILIAVILGIVRAGGVEIGRLAGTVAGVALFLAASLTLGRCLVADAIRLVNEEIVEIAGRRDQSVRILSRAAASWRDAILKQAEKERATLIVLGVSIRPSEALLFGDTANHRLDESPRSLLFVAS